MPSGRYRNYNNSTRSNAKPTGRATSTASTDTSSSLINRDHVAPRQTQDGDRRTASWRTAPPKETLPMNLIPSVSRSSGLDAGGDALKEHATQDKYLEYIKGKLRAYRDQYPEGETRREGVSRPQQEAEGNILILFRKLREGIVASSRVDSFTLETYETSTLLSLLFDAPSQASAIATHLITAIYTSNLSITVPSSPFIALIYLLIVLLTEYPSQATFQNAFHHLPSYLLPSSSSPRTYITQLSSALRNTNYARFHSLARVSHPLLAPLDLASSHSSSSSPLRSNALAYLFQLLLAKARRDTWLVLRSSYKEISIAGEGRAWLERSLGFAQSDGTLERWMREKTEAGEAAVKGETGERWILYKTAQIVPVQH
ncbi:hypothetical protein BOTBODRAFT_173136 [Botryobasidium botryosum FD-172 SS1]|uniref:Uncharacterized protein n=1 Tax=Botryobasidium botryosum (strain FD-172 SS1) TaxID=930990 RepID=A0A067MKD0_BOTB1|nr:hypothetical protein BOTBODRAFT_173136 [Botryobasidium botryosum FD-172 SS1]